MSEITDEAYLLGREASLKGNGIDTNPFMNASGPESRYWEDGFRTEEEHTRLLGIHFAAKKGLEEKVEEQEEQIKTLESRLLLAETHRDEFKNNLSSMVRERDIYNQFVRKLRDSPRRWAKQYREMVEVFCESIGI